MSGVYSLSTTVDITFILPKLDLKTDKKAIKLFKLHFWLCVKNGATFHHFFFFSLIIPKVLYKSVLLSIITFRHSLLTYYTQRYFIKALYYLAKTQHSLIERHLSIPKAYSKCVLLG